MTQPIERPSESVLVSPEMLEQLQEWSPPVEMRIVRTERGLEFEVRTATAHQCIVKVERDQFTHVEQYLVSCQCHMGSSYKTWRPGDPDVTCPDGTVLNTAITTEAGK